MGNGVQDKYEKMVVRQTYGNVWHTSLMDTMQADLPFCFFAVCCSQCSSYALRKQALYGDMKRYECCGGYMPCSGKIGEKKCPELCLLTEVCCCLSNSVMSTRFLIQDELNIQTTDCDNCIIGFMFCLGQIACIFSLVAAITGSDELEDAAEILNCCADLVFCTVCACMQTQHKIELDKRDSPQFGVPPFMMVPPMQQMSRIDQPVPPTVGYPPPYGYGYPPTVPAYPHAGAPPPPGYPAYPPPGGYHYK